MPDEIIEKGVKRGYGSANLNDEFDGTTRCPARDGEKRCSAVLTFERKSLAELKARGGEIVSCSNPDGMEPHQVLVFTGHREGQDFPFAQATYLEEK